MRPNSGRRLPNPMRPPPEPVSDSTVRVEQSLRAVSGETTYGDLAFRSLAPFKLSFLKPEPTLARSPVRPSFRGWQGAGGIDRSTTSRCTPPLTKLALRFAAPVQRTFRDWCLPCSEISALLTKCPPTVFNEDPVPVRNSRHKRNSYHLRSSAGRMMHEVVDVVVGAQFVIEMQRVGSAGDTGSYHLCTVAPLALLHLQPFRQSTSMCTYVMTTCIASSQNAFFGLKPCTSCCPLLRDQVPNVSQQ